MSKHRLLIVGAGRIGAGFGWHDDVYTHAGAARALSDRVELVGFVDPSIERAGAAMTKWKKPVYQDLPTAIHALKPDLLSVCVQPEQQVEVLEQIPDSIKGIWCEKPYMGPDESKIPIQVNYLRRADPSHQYIASVPQHNTALIVYGKDDIHTKCHFLDLAKWWKCQLDYRVFNGPCAYIVTGAGSRFFDKGGVDPAYCMKGMLKNLLDCVDFDSSLWSPIR